MGRFPFARLQVRNRNVSSVVSEMAEGLVLIPEVHLLYQTSSMESGEYYLIHLGEFRTKKKNRWHENQEKKDLNNTAFLSFLFFLFL